MNIAVWKLSDALCKESFSFFDSMALPSSLRRLVMFVSRLTRQEMAFRTISIQINAI